MQIGISPILIVRMSNNGTLREAVAYVMSGIYSDMF